MLFYVYFCETFTQRGVILTLRHLFRMVFGRHLGGRLGTLDLYFRKLILLTFRIGKFRQAVLPLSL